MKGIRIVNIERVEKDIVAFGIAKGTFFARVHSASLEVLIVLAIITISSG